jgi:diacylglycerol kinase
LKEQGKSVKWRRSFRFAYEGLKYALSTQRNLKFHFFAAFLALFAALYFRLPKMEIIIILLAVTLMIVTELINTAIEKTVDLAMPDIHPLAKIAKDVAAASVLVSAVFAAVTGMIVFYEPIDRLFQEHGLLQARAVGPGSVWIVLSLAVLTVVVVETRFADGGRFVRPSLISAFAFAVATVITIATTVTLVSLLAYTLALLATLILYDKQSRSFPSLMFGAAIGIGTAVLAGFLLQ